MASDAADGNRFGWSVAIDGDTLVVSTQSVKSSYIYIRVVSTWIEQRKVGQLSRLFRLECGLGR